MSDTPELVIIGAGPAGMAAATAAAESGVDTLLLEEAAAAGGQIHRPLPSSFRVRDAAALGPDHAEGERLRRALAASGARTIFSHRVWRVAPGFEIEAIGPDGLRTWRPRAVIAATGAYERILPFPGWTEPGVIGLAAATILLKSQQMLPGRRTILAGCGPLLAAVASGILKAGGEVAAIVDVARRSDWLKALPGLAARPDLVARGLSWLAAIRAARVPIYHHHAVLRAESDAAGLLRVAIAPLGDGKSAPHLIEGDALAVGHGLVPSTEIGRLLGAAHDYVPQRGGWVMRRDESCRSSVACFYGCGDGTGIAGGAAAALEGRLAGLTVALDLGKLSADSYRRATRAFGRRLARTRRAGRAMARLMQPRPDHVLAQPAETIICRCEEISRAEIEDAVRVGAVDLNQLKSWTRAGMGPCQGRMCGESVGIIAGACWGGGERAAPWTGRLPLRPIPLDALIGDYRYEDIAWGGNKARIDDEGKPLARGERVG